MVQSGVLTPPCGRSTDGKFCRTLTSFGVLHTVGVERPAPVPYAHKGMGVRRVLQFLGSRLIDDYSTLIHIVDREVRAHWKPASAPLPPEEWAKRPTPSGPCSREVPRPWWRSESGGTLRGAGGEPEAWPVSSGRMPACRGPLAAAFVRAMGGEGARRGDDPRNQWWSTRSRMGMVRNSRTRSMKRSTDSSKSRSPSSGVAAAASPHTPSFENRLQMSCQL